MHTISEEKSPIDLKNSAQMAKWKQMTDLNRQGKYHQSNLSAIEELNMRYVKQFSEQFVWYAAVGYDMVAESVASNW